LTDQSTKEIDAVSAERIGIAGGGAIASGLACVAAEHGQVVLWARRPDAANAKVERLIEKRGGLGAGNVSVSADLDCLGDATFIVEAIAEEQDAKAALLRDLGGAAANGAILATTTSALSVTALAAATGRPEHFVGLHVFNPVPKMDLVELVFPPEAGADTRERARALCAALGKTAVEVPDQAGFVVNRLLFPYLFDAVRLMESTGMAAPAVDSCMTLGAGHPMGPLELLDFVGLDVAVAIGDELHGESGLEPHRPPRLLRALVADAKLGRKSGAGFYDYD
jgi:3-hydroxybutyryl-CoA dehydrogenase